MKRLQKASLVLGLGASLALTSILSGPRDTAAAESNCPAVNYDYVAEAKDTLATGIVHNLGAFALGFLDRGCRDGAAVTDEAGSSITYHWTRTVHRADIFKTPASTYTIELRATTGSDEQLDPNDVSNFTIEEHATWGTRNGLMASVEAVRLGQGWRMTVVEPSPNGPAHAYSDTTSTISTEQACSVARLAVGIIGDGLNS